jgi:hypothetical protein
MVYWYISRPKVEFLKAKGSKWRFEEISFDLKLLSFEAGAKVQPNDALLRDLENVIRGIESENRVLTFESIPPGEAPNIFSFEGEAARRRSDGCYWVAMAKGPCALLLAGSATNAIGAATPQVDFSPSVDPVGAIQSLLKGSHAGSPENSLPYAWQSIMEGPFAAASLTRPRVQGLGLFAEMFAVDPLQMGTTHGEDVVRLVVGSPIYVRQLAREPNVP